MLSVGSSNEGMKRPVLGLEGKGSERRRDMEENELEEGEAFFGQDDDIDPDALSYIDEKLQHVLGHFQKEFEGGVSAETLGSKFGGYGSFLPAYQRSPPVLLSETKSPAKVPGHSLSRSPYSLQHENPSVLANASIGKSNIAPAVQLSEKSSQKDTFVSSSSTEDITQHEPSRQTQDSRDPKSLKVRIKVGPDNVSTRNKPEIYSDLGLDISSSPSLEDSPTGSREPPHESPEIFCDSPSTILEIMTIFPVPGGSLLSPLSESLLHLFEEEDTSIKNVKASKLQKVMPENCTILSDPSLQEKDINDFTYKEYKSREKGRKLVDAHGLTCEDIITTSLKNEIGGKTPGSQKAVFSARDMSFPSNAQSIDAKDPNTMPLMEGDLAQDLRKDDAAELNDGMRVNGVGNLDKEIFSSKRNAYAKTVFTEKAFEEANGKVDICRKNKSKSQKNPDKKKADSDKDKMRKDYAIECEEHIKEQLVQKTCLSEKIVFKMTQTKDQAFEGGKIIKGSQNKGNMLANSNKESIAFSVAPKGVKKMSNVKDSHLETKSKIPKPQKELNKGHLAESQNELSMNAQIQKVENTRHMNGSSKSIEKSKERSVNKGESCRNTGPTNVQAPRNDIATNNNSMSAIPALVLIEDNWVCCDICQRWRLLPYGTNPESLPKKWQCSMQVWLPGLNNCSVSQDETTKAFHELYQFPAPASDTNLTAHHNIAASSLTSADALNPDKRLENVMHSTSFSGKKKHGSMDSAGFNDSSLRHLPNSSKNFSASSGNKNVNDAGYCMEMNSLIKPKPGLTRKSMDIATEKPIHKQKEKHKVISSKIGGDLTERVDKYSKPLSNRGIDVDGHRASKKHKSDGSYHSQKDLPSSIETSSKTIVNGDTEFLAKVSRNTMQNYSDHSSSKDLKSKGASSRKSREQANPSNGKHKEISSASEAVKFSNYDSIDKKRKHEIWQESQACQEISTGSEHAAGSRPMLKESLIDSDSRRHKKVKVAKSEGKESHTVFFGENAEMKGCSTRVALSANKKHLSDIIDNDAGYPASDEQMVQYQGNATSGQALDCLDGLKRDVPYKSLAATTSSSSKVSGSQKGKMNFPETRGSPVESVSSSPVRILNNGNNYARRNSSIKDNAISTGYSGMNSPKRFSDGELDGFSDHSGTRAKGQTQPKNNWRKLNFNSDKGKHKAFGSINELKDLHTGRACRSGRTDSEFDQLNSIKKDDLKSHTKLHKVDEVRDGSPDVNHNDLAAQQNLHKASSQEKQIPSSLLISEAIDRSATEFRKGMQISNTTNDKLEKKVFASQTAPGSIKGAELEHPSVVAVNSGTSKLAVPSRKLDVHNGTLPNLSLQSASRVPGSSSPMKKDGHPNVNSIIKEARDLKHTAARLKNEGLENESSGIFFESALKFLHAASLLEPPNSESARSAELVISTQMILIYFETAKFCEFCAHEYEKLKEMAAAALAYKCAEVAYMKVAMYKSSSANKDRLELQVALDAPLPGDSPSSSASDVDNINNHGGLDKVASARVVSSPQIATNHAIPGRNRPNVVRILTYLNYVNCAFESSKKSNHAMTAASSNLGKNGIDLSSVRTVLDFNYHNVEALLRLVRRSMNSIGH